VRLIYYYRLGADGFKSGDRINHPDYEKIINDAINDRSEYYVMKYKLQEITPKLMSEIILDRLLRSVVYK